MMTADDWRATLERDLPPSTSYCARSQAITARYARWYLDERWLFKWAGMAAFASAQVGHGIALAELLLAPQSALCAVDDEAPGLAGLAATLYGRALNAALAVPVALHDAATRRLLLADLELVKQANDAIFHDIGWAHLAYQHGGLPAIEAGLAAPGQRQLRDAFRTLDAGAHAIGRPGGYAEGAALIAQGAVEMLRHEQHGVLPAYMERLSPAGQALISLASALDFTGDVAGSGMAGFATYYGPAAVLAGQRSIARSADRWAWVEGDVLPTWWRVDAAAAEGGALMRRLAALASARPSLLQRGAGLASGLAGALAGPARPAAGRRAPAAAM